MLTKEQYYRGRVTLAAVKNTQCATIRTINALQETLTNLNTLKDSIESKYTQVDLTIVVSIERWRGSSINAYTNSNLPAATASSIRYIEKLNTIIKNIAAKKAKLDSNLAALNICVKCLENLLVAGYIDERCQQQ